MNEPIRLMPRPGEHTGRVDAYYAIERQKAGIARPHAETQTASFSTVGREIAAYPFVPNVCMGRKLTLA